MAKDPSQPLSSLPREGHTVKIGEASRILGLHKDTLRRWEKSGKLTPIRTPAGTRLYSINELRNLVPKVSDDIPQPPQHRQLPAKKPRRIDEEGVYSHVYNKGVEGRFIFKMEDDYKVFQGFLKDYLTAPKDPDSIKKDFSVHGRIFQGTPHQPKNYFNQVELIAYCLIPDHFHLLLRQVTAGSIENFIRSLCTRYSMYFNKKYRCNGALFEGPYKSVAIKDESYLPLLTRYLHQTGSYSSYPEYLGLKRTSWIKPKVVPGSYKQSLKLGGPSYKDFVEKYELDQKEKEALKEIILENEPQHFKERNFAGNEEISNPNLEPRSSSRLPDFLTISAVLFILLVTFSVGNIKLSTAKSPHAITLGMSTIISTPKISQPLPTPIQSGPTPAVTAETEEAVLAETEQVKPKAILTIKTNDASASVNIRQKPSTSSAKIGEAKNGDTFEFVSQDSEWYEVKLPDGLTPIESGLTGFIFTIYAVMEEINN